ncbi:class III signal peptide [Pyrobaculum aerophilum]|uniref:Class III signal peptide n=1 Tax=Pyrobaculum aerophilum TaxID=13773 RepID=A0A371R6F8_9CREN|nr:class III signal peptide [Pyrobaculum aerophilum]RFA97155.1 class III signal peptide [Pyrobaculum aerophilum]RFB00054.1 class III signal peptide [Pyrobaculum aerophilum]
MPTKLKGMTSIEIAIIVAIVLIIAVAVGWYLYTTFVASTGAQARLATSNAEYVNATQRLRIFVTNPGPVNVTITGITLQGQPCSLVDPSSGASKWAVKEAGGIKIVVGGSGYINATCSVKAVPGTSLSGYVTTSAGTSFPFTAVVR